MIELQNSLRRALGSVGDLARHHVLALPTALLPFETCRLYPQAIDRIFRQWNHPALFRSEIRGLFLDHRRSRHGFPLAVLNEMRRVHAHYDALFPQLSARQSAAAVPTLPSARSVRAGTSDRA